ncbi:MAG: (d)CMP kinase [Planctomycetales bacterium]|nr:(d)CMP kinase [Planctomycetales bacterium]
MMNPTRQGLVIAIDGPAGAGKSTVARMLAQQLGFDFLDTGALYRCVTLAVLRADIDPHDAPAVSRLASTLQLELEGESVRLNGQQVANDIRTPEVASAIGTIADNVQVRKQLTRWQREWTRGRRVVTEGRDQGSEVFYDSPCKFFLVAGSATRAQRRLQELRQRGIDIDYDTVLQQQDKRDQEDVSRSVGGLRKAPDAIEVCSDGLSLELVVAQLRKLVVERLGDQLELTADFEPSPADCSTGSSSTGSSTTGSSTTGDTSAGDLSTGDNATGDTKRGPRVPGRRPHNPDTAPQGGKHG